MIFFYIENKYNPLYSNFSSDVIHFLFLALTSLLFPAEPEAAFSVYNLMFSIAASFTFGISFFLCFHVKMYLLLALLVAMTVCYMLLEHRQAKHDTYTMEIKLEG